MSGAIEADTDHILPRTGYIPTNEPTSLLAQGIQYGVRVALLRRDFTGMAPKCAMALGEPCSVVAARARIGQPRHCN
jgi:hypothetical protein